MKEAQLELVVTRRAHLIQFLIFVIAVIQCLVLYAVLNGRTDWTVPAAIVVSLVACVYTASRERKLSKLHSAMLLGLAKRKEQVLHGKKETARLGSRLGEMTTLYRSIAKVNAAPNSDGVLEAVVDSALELVDANLGSLMLFDEEANRLVLTVGRGLAKEAVLGSRQPADAGVAGWVLNQNEPLLLEGNADDDGRFQALVQRGKPVKSSLCIPLNLHGERVGVLNLALSNTATKAALTEMDRSLAAIFAQHAAVAVQNARRTHPSLESSRLSA